MFVDFSWTVGMTTLTRRYTLDPLSPLIDRDPTRTSSTGYATVGQVPDPTTWVDDTGDLDLGFHWWPN